MTTSKHIQHALWRRAALALATTCLALPAMAATSGYSQTWDTAGDLAGWVGNTIDSVVSNPGVGGHGGGYLETARSGAFSIGADTELPAATGSFGGQVWTAKVDLIGLTGTTSDVWLRFRYQDSTFNGWRYRLTDALTGDWQTHAVSFDASWSDLEAKAHGWQTDFADGSGSVGWAQTLSKVYTTEIRIDGTPALKAGIDNFSLSAVPEPSSCALVLAGLGVAAALKRRRR
ncbi:PEP-CTERM sorting domain-containing protein [Aquabacterium sp.]|uniref:PEP-CTERM sorting domain-containing protein n=1 Tax=Aquabacterium sp. TaxID=1872578 RepID=UPI003D6CF650